LRKRRIKKPKEKDRLVLNRRTNLVGHGGAVELFRFHSKRLLLEREIERERRGEEEGYEERNEGYSNSEQALPTQSHGATSLGRI
jgi:hypothetical protein